MPPILACFVIGAGQMTADVNETEFKDGVFYEFLSRIGSELFRSESSATGSFACNRVPVYYRFVDHNPKVSNLSQQ